MAGLDIPHLSVFSGKLGQPCETQNHLTELLDERPGGSYSERTLQPGRTPGRGSQGARRELPVKERKRVGRRSASSNPTESGAPLEKAPEPQPGPFHLGASPASLAQACLRRACAGAVLSARASAAPAHVGRGSQKALVQARNQVRRVSTISVGSLTESIVHPREVFREAI